MDIYEHIAQMKPLIAARDWDGLETAYRECCVELAGEEQATTISGLDFASYETALNAVYAEAVRQAEKLDVKSLYFEYDLDNLWSGNFFLCGEYNSEEAADDDWACDWLAEVEGPDFEEAADVYEENHLDRTPIAQGSTLYLIARTIAAFGRCLNRHPSGNWAVCIAFHDQDPVMRLREYGKRA